MRIVFADVESTGIRPDRGAEVWEIGLVVRHMDRLTDAHEIRKLHDDEYCWQIRPDLEHADPVALKIGGYYQRCKVADRNPGDAEVIAHPNLSADTERELRAVFPFDWAVARFIAGLLDGAHLVAANPAFDSGHLDAFLRARGQALTVDYHYVDVASLVRGWAHGIGSSAPWPLKLADAARLTGIDPAGYRAHSALDDARLARDVFDAVTGGGPR